MDVAIHLKVKKPACVPVPPGFRAARRGPVFMICQRIAPARRLQQLDCLREPIKGWVIARSQIRRCAGREIAQFRAIAQIVCSLAKVDHVGVEHRRALAHHAQPVPVIAAILLPRKQFDDGFVQADQPHLRTVRQLQSALCRLPVARRDVPMQFGDVPMGRANRITPHVGMLLRQRMIAPNVQSIRRSLIHISHLLHIGELAANKLGEVGPQAAHKIIVMRPGMRRNEMHANRITHLPPHRV